MDDLVDETEVSNLWVVRCWADGSQAGEWDISAVTALNQRLLGRFDWVVYDGGSVNTEFGSKLLQAIGKVVVVTTEADTALACAAEERVEREGAVSLGCVENLYAASDPVASVYMREENEG